ncbi:unnamed protein product [Durusdinium trenchii]|uniref:C3H1-type domain-containing protein n=1 Tax=Durusdinium trenchii TaxID=1381693 RepID=A0ABP0J8P2_9DINO
MAAVVNYEKDMKRLQVHKQTRLCRFFVVGACTRGEACTFAHGQDKLRQQPDFSKTRLCADFMERGSCAEGDRCKFAHGKSELRPGSAVKLGRLSKKEMQNTRAKSHQDQASVAMQVKKTFQLQHSLHSQAAMKLMMKSTIDTQPNTLQQELEIDPENCLWEKTSFSRQTTWEGIETTPGGFSRATSLGSEIEVMGTPSRTRQELGEWQVQVKNTFIEVSDSDGSETEQDHWMLNS